MYIAPLRHAVIHLGAVGVPFTTTAVALIGTATDVAARRYLARLVAEGILLDLPRCRFIRTTRFDSWSRLRPKTRPGGHRRLTYRAVKEVEHAHSA